MKYQDLRINSQRMQADFDALARIGSTGDGGVHRPALSPADLKARLWLRKRIEDSGLEFRLDPAGNLSGFLNCAGPTAPTLLLGSHLDSVPHGGRFDGALGVVAALEALHTIKEAGLRLSANLEAIDFTDEEGTLVGLLGSSALAGRLEPEDLQKPRGGREALLIGLEHAGLSETGLLAARRDPHNLAGYLELHIEQGARLQKARIGIGVVTSIVGIGSYRLAFIGRADHAGTTYLPDRLDAGLGASAFHLEAQHLVLSGFPECVVNIGEMNFEPGAFNIVPGRASLSLEYRSPDTAPFERLETALLAQARQIASERGLGVEETFLGKHQPALMSPVVQSAIAAAADNLATSHIPLSSGAGHDAQSFARLCPAGMLFVPSISGASHSPREFTEWQDCINGANVLLQAALNLIS